MGYIEKYKFFHGCMDTEFATKPGRFQLKGRKYFIIQERELRYRFYLHQHPYMQQLIQKLIREDIPGLQAADTQYQDNAFLPGSIEIALDNNTSLILPDGSRLTLLQDVQATSGSTSVELTADMQVRLAKDTQATLLDEAKTKATLLGGMAETPSVGGVFTPSADSKAIFLSAAKVVLAVKASLTLLDGTQVTVPSGTQVLLAGGTQVTLPNGIQVTLLKSKPLPELFLDFFEATYQPNQDLVQWPYPAKDLDFTSGGAYSVYNWEIFFHVPFTIAIHLSKNQRFAEAHRWFHYLFDPTDDSDGPTPERFWKVHPFRQTDVKKIEEILVNLVTGADETLRTETINSINKWQDNPFRPHIIARYRQQAYMYKTVMAYLDNLIAWGDFKFRQDTGESIDEALMLYVQAANILGPRPQPVPKKNSVRPRTYANLRKDLKQFGSALVEAESDVPFDGMPLPSGGTSNNEQLVTLRSLGKALYFCVPRNDKLLSYWDTVADRLFKIRNSLNFHGIFRQLPLFEPPIDPALLARAAAAGLDVGSVVNGLNQPLPLVRFQLLVQKSTEIAQEVKSLGNSLLSAMEKEDNETLAILRIQHERIVMGMVEHVRYAQVQEAIKARESLLQSLALAKQRYYFYERQLGKKIDEIEKAIPELGEFDKESLTKMNFAMEEPSPGLREIEVDIAQDLSASGGKIMSSHERQEHRLLKRSVELRQEAVNLDMVAKFLSLIPELGGQAQPMGVGAAIQFGGRALSTEISFVADSKRMMAERDTYGAGQSARIDSYARREQEWAFQANLAAGEISQIFKQLRAAELRQAIAELELENHRKQMEHAEKIESFLNEEGKDKTGKKTNKALYTWKKREVKGLYSQCFQFAFDIAKKAERALQHEFGNPELRYLQLGYLSGKEGLLAGEKLYLDIKRMEMAYHDLNQREYELTKNISLLQVDPLALIQLRTTGRCTIRLPEALFDLDGPGHYFRRIKMVALSIPCVSGPYASVNCTLTLLKSSIRKNQLLREGVYARESAEDDRFNDYFGSLQSIVTSSAQNDSGLFETNLRDERYLPFENSGVISEWQLQLPANPSKKEPCQFDYDTISDVILHIRYTAREGGGLLRKSALEHVTELIENAQMPGSVRLFSVRHEFPSEWAKFRGQKSTDGQGAKLTLNLRSEHYPFWSQERLSNTKYVDTIDILLRSGSDNSPPNDVKYLAGDANEVVGPASLSKDVDQGLLVAQLQLKDSEAELIGELNLLFKHNDISDLWIAIR